MKVNAKFKCECGFDTVVPIRKPDHFTPSGGVFICITCRSKWQYIIGKGKDKGTVKVQQRLVDLGEDLRLIREEATKEAVTP